MKEYKIINTVWSYDDVCNLTMYGDCDYIGEHYLVSLVNVNNPFDSITKRVENINFSRDEFYVGRVIKFEG